MQGERSGVVAIFLNEQPAAIPVHCFAHLLNLCLQDVDSHQNSFIFSIRNILKYAIAIAQ